MPLESERRIHDIWHNTSVYLRTCTIVYTHTHTYSYTNEQVNNDRSNLQRWTVGNGEHSSTKSSSKYWFWIFSTKLFYLAVKMLTIHAPHSKWHFNLPCWVRFCQSCAGEFYDNVWLNPRMSQWVQWFFSLPSVAWDDFARARPAHSMRETVRARGKPLTASDSPILWAGCVRAKIVPCYRWGDQCTVCRAWFKGSCLQDSPFLLEIPFFCHYDSFFWLHKVGSSVTSMSKGSSAPSFSDFGTMRKPESNEHNAIKI